MILPLVNCILNDAVVGALPNAQQPLHLRLINSLVNDIPYIVVDQIAVGAVWRKQIWSNKRGVTYLSSRIV